MRDSEVLSGVAKGDFHRRGGMKCERLFTLEDDFFSKLRSEIANLVTSNVPSEVAEEDHVTNWTKPYGRAIQFSLLNGSGQFDDTSADHTKTVFGKSFHHADKYPTLGEFIKFFPHAINMRLNGMSPSGGLSPHEEHIGWREGRKYFFRSRFHLPIDTNPDAVVLLDGDYFHLDVGSIYFFNNGCVHSAANRGNTQRYHLVWDMLLTEETIDLMFGDSSCGPLLRSRGADRTVPVRESVGIGEYEISGLGERLYRQLHLRSLNLKPYQWQNGINAARYTVFRTIGQPKPTPVR
jgi:hypothetical protein